MWTATGLSYQKGTRRDGEVQGKGTPGTSVLNDDDDETAAEHLPGRLCKAAVVHCSDCGLLTTTPPVYWMAKEPTEPLPATGGSRWVPTHHHRARSVRIKQPTMQGRGTDCGSGPGDHAVGPPASGSSQEQHTTAAIACTATRLHTPTRV